MTIEKKPTDALLFVKEGAKIVRSVSTSDMQIGTANQPAELQVTGRFSQSVAVVSAKPGQKITLSESSSTVVCVKVEQGNGSVTVVLPASPRKGQTVYIKDAAGRASSSNIIVTCPSGKTKIDGNESRTIRDNYDSVSLVWIEEGWVSVGGATTVTGPQGPETVVLSFGAAGYSNYSDPSVSEYNGFLYPAASLDRPLGYVSDPSAVSSIVGIPSPFKGKITALTVAQSLTEALPMDVTYRLFVNGAYESLASKASVKFPKAIVGRTGSWSGLVQVNAGDVLSIVVTQSNPAISGDSLTEALGGLTYLSACIVLTKS